MQNKEGTIKILVETGLTNSQAKVYLTLLTVKEANARVIWKSSGVARQHVYEILSELQNKHLVDKILAKPTKFRATPLQQGLLLLLEKKIKECKETQSKITKLCQTFPTKEKPLGEPEFVIRTPSPTDKMGLHIYDDINESIDYMAHTNRLMFLHFYLSEPILKALQRGVKMRLITEKPTNEKHVLQTLYSELKSKNFAIKYGIPFPSVSIAVFDHKWVAVDINPISEPAKTPALTTAHPTFVEIFQEYFEEIWNKAKKPEYKKRILADNYG